MPARFKYNHNEVINQSLGGGFTGFNLKLSYVKSSRAVIFFIPITLSLCILVICYPGFMSYDSIRMLEEARSSVVGGVFPAAPVYILRLFDVTGHGPTLMIQAQNFVLLLSVTLILRMLGAGFIATAISLLAFVAMPTVIGCMLVLWKDVTLAALVMLSIAMIFWASQASREDVFYQAAKWSSLMLLIVGTLVRFNAITSTTILAIYWLTVFYRDKGWKIRGAAFILIVLGMVSSNKVINGYSFPDFKKLENNTILYGVMANDLIGISGWSRVSLIPFDSVGSVPSPKVPIVDVDNIYSSLGSAVMQGNNLRRGEKVNVFPAKYRNEDITNAWLAAVTTYPMAYIRYRLDLFSEIIGTKTHGTYEPTHFNRIDENKFGIKFQDRYITNATLKYIKSASSIFLGKPWFVFSLSFFSVLFLFKNRLIRPELRRLSCYSFAAAVLYLAPFLIISSSGEVRYSFPAIALSISSILIWMKATILSKTETPKRP